MTIGILTMPRMGGKEAFEEIRNIRDDIPVIISSGYSEKELEERFPDKKPAGFIQKPYRAAVLEEKLRAVLER